jgi:hypothetical protein
MVAIGSLGAWWKTLPSAEAAPKAKTCSSSAVAQCVQDAEDIFDRKREICEEALNACTDDPTANVPACGAGFQVCRFFADRDLGKATRECHKVCGGGLRCTNDTCCKEGVEGCNGSCYDPNTCEKCVNGVIEEGCPPPKECDGAGNCVCPGVTQECGDTCYDPDNCEECVNGALEIECLPPKECDGAGNCVCPGVTQECGDTCCNPDNCERCGADGQCVACEPCEECKPVPDPIGGTVFQCVLLPETTPCGETCCGSCQTCEEGQCRNCDSSPPRCETCDATGACVPKTCEAPLVLNSNCECACPPGQSAHLIQSHETAVGAMTAFAAQAAAVCCPEGEEPCGDSGACCPSGKCCGNACCGSCQVCEGGQCRNCDSSPPKCEICEGGKCDTMTCEEPKILNTTNCQCVCPPPPPPPPPPGPGEACISSPECLCGTRIIPTFPPAPQNIYCDPARGFKCCGTATTAYCCKTHEKCNPAGGCFPC